MTGLPWFRPIWEATSSTTKEGPLYVSTISASTRGNSRRSVRTMSASRRTLPGCTEVETTS